MKTKLLTVVCAALMGSAGLSEAGRVVVNSGGTRVAVGWGGYRGGYYGGYRGGYRYGYYPRRYVGYAPYYRPWYVPRVVVGVPPVVVAAPPVVVRSGTFSSSVVVAAQYKLQKMGYYQGGVDGAFGPLTSQAIRGFQVDNGLPVTGQLDPQTRARLGI